MLCFLLYIFIDVLFLEDKVKVSLIIYYSPGIASYMGLDCSPHVPTRGSYNQFNSPATTSQLASEYAKLSSNDYQNKINSKHRTPNNPRQPARSKVTLDKQQRVCQISRIMDKNRTISLVMVSKG